jgi:hypothetical protein
VVIVQVKGKISLVLNRKDSVLSTLRQQLLSLQEENQSLEQQLDLRRTNRFQPPNAQPHNEL